MHNLDDFHMTSPGCEPSTSKLHDTTGRMSHRGRPSGHGSVYPYFGVKKVTITNSSNSRHPPNVGPMLGQRRRNVISSQD